MQRNFVIRSALLALGAHLVLGWPFSVLGAVLAGYLVKTRPVLAGTATLVLSWGGLVLFSFITAGPESAAMTGVMGELIGGLPPFMTVVLTMIIAIVLGALGAWVGSTLNFKQSKKSQS